MDAFARGLKIAAAIREDGRLDALRQASATARGIPGSERRSRRARLGSELEAYMLKKGEAAPNDSGRQEFLENLINEFI